MIVESNRNAFKAPIRILHMIGSFEVGGSQALVINLYKSIDRERVQFDFIVDHPERMELASEVQALGARIYFMPKFVGWNIFEIKKAWENFFSQHTEYGVLHSHVRSYASLYIPIAKKHGLKTVIHSHSTSNGQGISAIVKRVMQYPLRYQADYLMACSSESGRWLYGKKACEKDNYVFLPNAIDIEKYRYSKEVDDKYRKTFGLEEKFIIGHVGRFHKAKNHMFLLDVFAIIHKKCPDAVLLLVGDGDLRSDVVNRIKELNLENQVILTGNRNDVHLLMQMMNVFAFPSIWEGLPVTVIEAQAAGLPCVISDSVTNDVVVSDLVVRLTIDDPMIWADKLLDLPFQKKDVTTQISESGFDVKDVSNRLMSFYEKILKEKQPQEYVSKSKV